METKIPVWKERPMAIIKNSGKEVEFNYLLVPLLEEIEREKKTLESPKYKMNFQVDICTDNREPTSPFLITWQIILEKSVLLSKLNWRMGSSPLPIQYIQQKNEKTFEFKTFSSLKMMSSQVTFSFNVSGGARLFPNTILLDLAFQKLEKVMEILTDSLARFSCPLVKIIFQYLLGFQKITLIGRLLWTDDLGKRSVSPYEPQPTVVQCQNYFLV